MTFRVTKADGTTEPFNEGKLRRSLRRSGAGPAEVEAVASQVETMLYEGMRTQEIYRRAFELLRDTHLPTADRYSLRRALFNLGPTGFPFEKFLARLFELDGYTTKTNLNLQGHCAMHEIDVAGYRPDHSFIAEAKFHARNGLKSDLQVAMYSYARLLDLKNTRVWDNDERGVQEFWLITNTKFTTAAIQYANCVGVPLLGWDFPKEKSLYKRIEEAGVYPITVLQNLNSTQTATLISRGVIFCTDILVHPRQLQLLHLSDRKTELLLEEVASLCEKS